YPDADQRKRAFALQRLEPVLTKLLVLKDLILEGLVILLPTALIGGKHEPGFIYSTDFFGPKGSANDLIGRSHPLERFPESLRRAALDRVSIHPVKADLMGNISPEWNKPLSPARTIALAFPGENQYTIRLLSTVLADPNRAGVIQLYYNPDDPVDVDTFLNWVEGSKADLANERLEVLIRDLTVATLARASFLTPFPTSRDLLEITGPTTQDVILTQILRLDLPYFETVTPRDLLRARKNEAAFHDFRIALEQALQEAAQSSDSRSVEKAIREAVAGPIARVEARMRSLRRTIAINSALLAGTLGVGLFSQQKPLLLIAAMQLLGHYRNLKAAEDQVKESRGYFYWDVTRYAKKRQL
ncbi:MAG: hypothetical protein K6U74_16485, partial [Firmicutes bacterium]|nr:hypothetical protein [Bacillota bacterium]